MLNEIIKEKFIEFYCGNIPMSDFEEWLYFEEHLQNYISEDFYLSLISLDYKKHDAIKDAKELVRNIYKYKEGISIEWDVALYIAQLMLDNSISLTKGSRILSDLNMNGANFIPLSFVGYSSEIERLGTDSFYRDRILTDAKDLLSKLKLSRSI